MLIGSKIIYNYSFEQKTKCLDKEGNPVEKFLIENFDKDSIIEGCSPDLTLGEIAIPIEDNQKDYFIPFLLKDKSEDDNKRNLTRQTMRFEDHTIKTGIVRFIPRYLPPWKSEYYLEDATKKDYNVILGSTIVFTEEIVNMGMIDIQIPFNNLPATNFIIKDVFLWGEVKPRGTLVRSRVALDTFTISPNYQGKLAFLMYPVGENCFDIELGSRFANITFHPVIGEVLYPYGTKGRGYWQGDTIEKYGKKVSAY